MPHRLTKSWADDLAVKRFGRQVSSGNQCSCTKRYPGLHPQFVRLASVVRIFQTEGRKEFPKHQDCTRDPPGLRQPSPRCSDCTCLSCFTQPYCRDAMVWTRIGKTQLYCNKATIRFIQCLNMGAKSRKFGKGGKNCADQYLEGNKNNNYSRILAV